jgi:TetR/AcrR family transcriptional regulator, transcriptional repressor for nem operon
MARQSLREEIVAAAVTQFAASGFNATGVKDITDTAGAPKGSFYNHFESKEALAVVALERYSATRRLRELADQRVDPVKRLRRHFEFLADEIAGFGFTRGCMLGNFSNEVADHSAVIRAGLRAGLDAWLAALADVLGEAVRAGTVDPGLDPPSTARFILSAWQGAIVLARTERSQASFDAFFAMVFDRLLAPPAT